MDSGGAGAPFAAEAKRPAPPKIEPEFRVIPAEPPADDSPTVPTVIVSPLTGQPVSGLTLGERLLAARAVESTGFFTPYPPADADPAYSGEGSDPGRTAETDAGYSGQESYPSQSGQADSYQSGQGNYPGQFGRVDHSGHPGETDHPDRAGRPEHLGHAGQGGQDRAYEAGSVDGPDPSARESHLRLVRPEQNDVWASPREPVRDESRQESQPSDRAESDRAPGTGRTSETGSAAAAYPARVFPRIFEPLEPPAEMPGLFESRKPLTPAPSLFEPVQHRLSEPPAEQRDVRSAAERLSAPPADATAPRPGDATPPWSATAAQQPGQAAPRSTDRQPEQAAPPLTGWPQHEQAAPQPDRQQHDQAAPQRAGEQQHEQAASQAGDWRHQESAAPSTAGWQQHEAVAPPGAGWQQHDSGSPWSDTDPAGERFSTPAAAARQGGQTEQWRDDAYGSGTAAEQRADQFRPATEDGPAQERSILPRFAVSRPNSSTPNNPAPFPSNPAVTEAAPSTPDRTTPRFPDGPSPQPNASATGEDPQQNSGVVPFTGPARPGPADSSGTQQDTGAFTPLASPAASAAGSSRPPFVTGYSGGESASQRDAPASRFAPESGSASGRPDDLDSRPTAAPFSFAAGPVDAPTAENAIASPSVLGATNGGDSTNGVGSRPDTASAPFTAEPASTDTWQQRDPLGSGRPAADASWQQWNEPTSPADTSLPQRNPGAPFGSGPAAAGSIPQPETSAGGSTATSASSWPDSGSSPFTAGAPWEQQNAPASTPPPIDAPWQQTTPTSTPPATDAPWQQRDTSATTPSAADAPWQPRNPTGSLFAGPEGTGFPWTDAAPGAPHNAPGSPGAPRDSRVPSSTNAPGDGTVHEGVLLPPGETRSERGGWSTPDSWGADDAWSAMDDWTPASPRSTAGPARDEARPTPGTSDDGWSTRGAQPSEAKAEARTESEAMSTEAAAEEEQKPEKRRRGLFRRRNQPPQATPAEPVPLRDEEYVDWVSGLGDRSADD